jgi:hypothetical protein
MSYRVENIIGIDNELINQLNHYHLKSNNKLIKKSLNPVFVKLASVLLLLICFIGFYTYFSFINLIYGFLISFAIALFLSFFMFNIYRLLFCGIFGPAKDKNDTNLNFATYFFKYFILIIIGSLFSFVSYTVFFHKSNIQQHIINSPEIKLDIISIFTIVNNLGGSLLYVGFGFFIFLFLLPQLIVELTLDKKKLKQISRSVDQSHLNKILIKNLYLKNIKNLKEDWKKNNLDDLTNRVISNNSNFKRNVANKLYNHLLDKQF